MLFPDGRGQYGTAFVVYLTNGMNFPDALAASDFQSNAGVGYKGPVLYVNGNNDTIPNETLAEICRLQPVQIIALGGNLAVDESLIALAEAAANSDDCFADYGLP